jgi:hypothetical protein
MSSTARSCGGETFGRRSEEAHEREEEREAREEWRSSSAASESTGIDGEVLGSGFGIAQPDGSFRGEEKEGMRGL